MATDVAVLAYESTPDSSFSPYTYIGPQDGVADDGTFLDAAILADNGERLYMSSRLDGCLAPMNEGPDILTSFSTEALGST